MKGLVAAFLASYIHWVQSQYSCGRPVISNRIVGGQDAKEGAWPWQVSIYEGRMQGCAGTLIHKHWVLTAAHCVLKELLPQYIIYFGRYRQVGLNKHEKFSRVLTMERHENFVDVEHGYDIALLRLTNPIAFTDYIQPVCLPRFDLRIPIGSECWITGWGYVRIGDKLVPPSTLQEAQVNVIGRKECNRLMNIGASHAAFYVTDKMICAGVPGGKRDACQGDSGGPLVQYVNGVWVQVGIVSFGEGCGDPNRPGVYTDLVQFQFWITQRVSGLPLVPPSVRSSPSLKGSINGATLNMVALWHLLGTLLSLAFCLILLTD